MKSKAKIDMTTGSMIKPVLLFALPICIGNMLQQLYNTVDALVVGNYCGRESLAAIGTSSQPVELLLCIFLGLGSGVSILVSQYTGSKDITGLKKVITAATSFLYMCAVPLSVLGLIIGPLVLKFMQVPDDVFAQAVAYVDIIFLGTLGNMGYNMNAGILRGVGDSSASLIFLIISCIVNIVLDIFFVAFLHMDVSGAALATTISMFISWFFSIYYIKKKYPELNLTILPKKYDKSFLKEILSVGFPLGMNNSLYSLGHIMMQSVINMQGSAFMAACSVATKVTGMANVAITSLSQAATTYSGQNYGAKNYIRLKRGGLRIPLMSGLITAIAGIAFTLNCEPVLRLFNSDPLVIKYAVRYIHVVLPFSWCYAVFNGIICYANGIGEIKFPTFVNILMLWAVRIPVGYFIAYFIDGTFVMACFPISFAFGMFAMFTFFFTKKWKEIIKLAK